MDTMKSDVFNYVLQEFQVSLDKITHRCFQVFFYLLWYSRKHQAVPHAAGLELDDSFFDSFYFLPRVREFTVSLRLAFSAARTPRTYTVPENLNGGFPGGPDVHQSCTVFYLWMLKYPQCCSWLWWVFEVALFQGQCSCAAEGSRHLVTWFPHNNLLATLANMRLQTVQVFFAVVQSGEVGWNVSTIPIVVTLKAVNE